MISRLLVGLLTNGHILLEGVPGVAKPRPQVLRRSPLHPFPADPVHPRLSRRPGGHRDLCPRPHIKFRTGPHFLPVPPRRRNQPGPVKVQSALLEAMQERQVTIGAVATHWRLSSW